MNLSDAFFEHAVEHPRDTALWVDGQETTYGLMKQLIPNGWPNAWGNAVPAVCNGISVDYEIMLGILKGGGAYVPWNLGAPKDIRDLVDGKDAPGLAYIMFTSGSTGEPKGVPITHENAMAYVRNTIERLNVTPADRFSQMHDLTFDFSVHDVWVPWNAGASVYVVPEKERFAPARFINEHKLTVFSCVPSVITSMDRLGLLTPNALPTLRYVVLCGEVLTVKQAEAIQRAAPNATVENMYGPTEATVGITSYTWDPEKSPVECRDGIVPIGRAFPGQRALVIDGELLLRGSQVFDGYWQDQSREAFMDGWYCTGDLVTADHRAGLHFLGRTDNQVQIQGFRVELGAVETFLREAAKTDEVACIEHEGHIAAFIAGSTEMGCDVRARCKKGLASYMVPKWICWRDELPHNANGKIDRKGLVVEP
jgi:acyl-coenzyme A synthetase/AMP-(fatty) acid ligase